MTVRDLGHSPRRHHIRTRYTAGVGINHGAAGQVTLTYLKRDERCVMSSANYRCDFNDISDDELVSATQLIDSVRFLV